MSKVLVVEDNPVNMKLAVLLLQKVGHQVLCARDGESAITLAQALQPDLILMDFQLPGMDGLSAIGLLKLDPMTATIPIIALTAMAMKASLINGKLPGCAAYLAKPYSYQELYAVINTLLEHKRWPPEEDQQYQVQRCVQDERVPPVVALNVAVDIRVLQNLIGNDPSINYEFLVAFKISAGTITQGLKNAGVSRQATLAGEHAHQLKSASYAVGALKLGNVCAALEKAGKANDIESLLALLPLFESDLNNVNTALDSMLAAMAH